MIEKPSPLVSDPVFIRGWNAAISHTEDYLVALGYQAANTQGVPNSRAYSSMPSFACRILMAAAEKIGRARRPVHLHHG